MITLNTEYRDFTGTLFVILIVKEDFAGESNLQSVADMHFKPR